MRRKGSKNKVKSNYNPRHESIHSRRLVTMECRCGRVGQASADSIGYICPICSMISAVRSSENKVEEKKPRRKRVLSPESLKSFQEKRAATAAKRKAARHQLASKILNSKISV